MTVVGSHIVPILWISGALTAGAIGLFLAPHLMLRLMAGPDRVGRGIVFLTRYVGLLVALIGCLIIYSANNYEVRIPVLTAAIIEKVVLVFSVAFGGLRRTPLLIAAAAADGCFAALYLAYLIGL